MENIEKHEEKLYGSDLGVFYRKFFRFIFILLTVLLLLFLLLKVKLGLVIIFICFAVLLGIYLGVLSDFYTFYSRNESLVIKNELFVFNRVRSEFTLKTIQRLNFRFDNAPQYGRIHLTFYSNEQVEKFKINSTLEDTEGLLSKISEWNIPLTFSNIQTSEQRIFAHKWMNQKN